MHNNHLEAYLIHTPRLPDIIVIFFLGQTRLCSFRGYVM